MDDKNLEQDHVSKAEGYLMLGMYQEALEEAAAVIEIEPSSYSGHYLRGIALVSLEQFAEAEAPLKQAIAIEPERPEAYIHLAYVHRRTVSLDKAIETIRRAVEFKPEMPLANYNLACYYAIKGERDDALRYLRRAISRSPDFRSVARHDEDFASLEADAEFRRLTEME